MKLSDKGSKDILSIAEATLIVLGVQIIYSVFEVIRHTIVDGYTDHTADHAWVLVFCVFFLYLFRHGYYETYRVRVYRRMREDK